MNMLLIHNEVVLRLGFFLGIFLSMALWEMLAPRRALAHRRLTRWISNLGITAFNSVLVYLVFPAAAVGTALYAGAQGWGLLRLIPLPSWAEGLAAIIVLDFFI